MLSEIFKHGRGATSEPFEIGETGVLGVTNLFVDLFASKIDGGVVLFDTGMDPRGRPIDRVLARLGKSRADVTDVFLTHCHPDHVAGAPLFSEARVHCGADDLPRLSGEAPPVRAAERWFRRLMPTPNVRPTHPHAGMEEVAIGAESVLILPMPGDTPGACAFLFRSVLFVGDALDLRGGELRAAFSYATDDALQNLSSIAALPERLDGKPIDFVCTAHGGATSVGEGRTLLERAADRARTELASRGADT